MFQSLRGDAIYNTRAVVQRTGVPADTFRAWERRYGVPSPKRTTGNQRLYSERDIATIAWLRDQTQEGLTISQAIMLLKTELSRAAEDGESSQHPIAAPHRPAVWDQSSTDRYVWYRDAVVDALIHFDGARADRIVEEAIALLPVEDVCLCILQEAMVEIGERWRRGELTISSEHYASSFVQRKFAALFNLSQPPEGRGPVVAACVEGELHELGLLLTSLFLSRHGYKIVYLGANLPLHDLIRTIEEVQPAFVLLSASTEAAVPTLVETTQAIQALSLPASSASGPVVGYGGRIFVTRPDLREQVHGVFLGENARDSVNTVDRLTAAAGKA